MLADRFVAYMTGLREKARRKTGSPTADEWVKDMDEVVADVRRAARFRLDDKAYDLVTSAMDREDALRASCPYLTWPAPQTWVEFTSGGMAIGMLFVTDEDEPDLKGGNVSVVAWPSRVAEPLQLHGTCFLDQAAPFRAVGGDEGLQLMHAIERRNGARLEAEMTVESYRKMVDTTGRTVAGTLALMNSPKTVRVAEEVDFVRLNKRRKQMNRPPLLSHRVVTIDLAKVERVLHEGDAAEPGAPRQQHFVRWHLRLVRGALYPVRPHWRGDPSLGIKAPPAYQLTASAPSHGAPPR